MLSFDDPRWKKLRAGYRVPIDLRPLLHRLASDGDSSATWREIWEELYHQGDVDEGSFVALPHLVHIHRQRGVVDWNTYALAATIEMARATGRNPDVPVWAKDGYQQALVELRNLALDELPKAEDPEAVRSILAFLALFHGARTYARVLLDFSEGEVEELERAAFRDGAS